MMRLGSDGLPVREVGKWTDEKLFYVRRYIDIFSTGMKAKWPRRVYIDLFAGPGRSVIEGTTREIDGSPIIALTAKDSFTAHFFNDIDTEATEALRERVRRIHGSAIVRNVDCNEAAREVPAMFFSGADRTLGLAFVDPTAFQIGLGAIRNMTAGNRIDVILTVMTGYMKRFMKQPSFERPLDHYFGSDGWQGLAGPAASERVTSRALLDYYEDRLRELGSLSSTTKCASRTQPSQRFTTWCSRASISEGQSSGGR